MIGSTNAIVHTHDKKEITDFPASLPANGGNADTIDGKHASVSLNTKEKSDLAKAINEVNTGVDDLKKSVSDGKQLVANAITRKGQAANGTDSFSALAGSILDIETKSILTGNAKPNQVLKDSTFYGDSPDQKLVGTIPTQAGTIAVPGTTRKTIVPGGTYVSTAMSMEGSSSLVPGNIKKGITIFGVVGTYQYEDLKGHLLLPPNEYIGITGGWQCTKGDLERNTKFYRLYSSSSNPSFSTTSAITTINNVNLSNIRYIYVDYKNARAYSIQSNVRTMYIGMSYDTKIIASYSLSQMSSGTFKFDVSNVTNLSKLELNITADSISTNITHRGAIKSISCSVEITAIRYDSLN